MIEIKAKISKIGNSYAFFIPKALVDCKALPLGEEIVLTVRNAKEGRKLKGLQHAPIVWFMRFNYFLITIKKQLMRIRRRPVYIRFRRKSAV